jgi:hypothetical protein
MAQDEAARIESINVRRVNTWMLLIHYDKVLEQVRSELSRPVEADPEGHIVGWSERVILPPFDIQPIYEALPDDGSNSDGGDIDIDIKRRA